MSWGLSKGRRGVECLLLGESTGQRNATHPGKKRTRCQKKEAVDFYMLSLVVLSRMTPGAPVRSPSSVEKSLLFATRGPPPTYLYVVTERTFLCRLLCFSLPAFRLSEVHLRKHMTANNLWLVYLDGNF